jgi:hypothetical protein
MRLRLGEQRRAVAEHREQLDRLQQHKLELESTCRLIDSSWSELSEFVGSQLAVLDSTPSATPAETISSKPPAALGERKHSDVSMPDVSSSTSVSLSSSTATSNGTKGAAKAKGKGKGKVADAVNSSASSFLERVLRAHRQQEAEHNELELRLADRTQWARKAIERLCGALQRADSVAVATLGKDLSGAAQLGRHQAETRLLQAKLHELRGKLAQGERELGDLETQRDELRTEADQRFVQLCNCQRRLDKLEGELGEARAAAAAASASAVAHEAGVAATAAAGVAVSSSSTPAFSAGEAASSAQYASMAPKKRAALMAQAAVEQEKARERVQQLEIDLKDTQHLAASRLAELEQLVTGRTELAKELTELRVKLATLPEPVLVQAHSYRQLKQHNQLLLNELSRARKAAEEAVVESTRTNARAAQERVAWEELYSARAAELEAASRDLKSRLRQACAEIEALTYENERNAADRPSTKLVDDFRSFADSQQRQLTKLREENRKLHDNLNLTQVTTDSGEILSSGQLFRRLSDKEKALAQKEVALKTREQEWVDREHDLRLVIDTYKSSQRDNRELVDVRQSEKRLEDRVARLTKEVEVRCPVRVIFLLTGLPSRLSSLKLWGGLSPAFSQCCSLSMCG